MANCFYGDYYPLTPYSLSEEAWISWAVRLTGSRQRGNGPGIPPVAEQGAAMSVRLYGLVAGAVYEVQDLDVQGAKPPGLRAYIL